MSLKTVKDKEGVKLKQYLLINLSSPYMVVLQMQSHKQ